jgi:hypothetical protein
VRFGREKVPDTPFLPRFFDRALRTVKEYSETVEYIHLNPVRAGLVRRPEDWRWSSYNNFALTKATVAACPIQIDYVRLPLGYRA